MFDKNQWGKDNRIVYRPDCKECRSTKVSIKEKYKKFFKHLMPKIGEEFTCPICQRTIIRRDCRDVVIDHSHKTGKIFGIICGTCNTGIGKLGDDPEILKRAILWKQGKLKG